MYSYLNFDFDFSFIQQFNTAEQIRAQSKWKYLVAVRWEWLSPQMASHMKILHEVVWEFGESMAVQCDSVNIGSYGQIRDSTISDCWNKRNTIHWMAEVVQFERME
jgi:hypothetical protein